ncbi:unnamed protein product [Clonostachys rosea f. rosea IK726]|jgi:hypothetical protein|uniref:Uncharacterized protein n=1 Tax=Clonostachys rosea f. rosea IK726 TaxID=1349383 RepID=A0ACA9TA24_BIOOC|nr:unnamed protein product [Clonostachys rosea f. rosea IK726]
MQLKKGLGNKKASAKTKAAGNKKATGSKKTPAKAGAKKVTSNKKAGNKNVAARKKVPGSKKAGNKNTAARKETGNKKTAGNKKNGAKKADNKKAGTRKAIKTSSAPTSTNTKEKTSAKAGGEVKSCSLRRRNGSDAGSSDCGGSRGENSGKRKASGSESPESSHKRPKTEEKPTEEQKPTTNPAREERPDPALNAIGLSRSEHKDQEGSEGPFHRLDKQWKQWCVDPANKGKETYGEKPIMQYQTSVTDQGGYFNTKWVETKDRNLPEGTNRRNMIKDGWKKAGGSLDKLKGLGDSNIINKEVKQSMYKAFAAQNKNYEGAVSAIFKPDKKGWNEINDNPFLGGYNKMLKENKDEFGNAKIKSVTATIHKGTSGINGDSPHHLLTILERPEPDA